MRIAPEDASRIRAAFPPHMSGEVAAVLAVLPCADYPTSQDNIGPVLLDGRSLAIPARVYFPQVPALAQLSLSQAQRHVLSCVYSRHHDGHVRELAVRRLFEHLDAEATPFVIQLLGEYVLEIVQLIHDRRHALHTPIVRRFVQENSPFLALTRQRAISYWNCYFRRTWPRQIEYPAFEALDFLEKVRQDGS